MQVLADLAQGGCGVVEVVVQVVLLITEFLDLLGGRLEELGEPFEESVGGFQDLVDEAGGVLVGSGFLELVREVQDVAAVAVVVRRVGGGVGVQVVRGG